MDKELARAEMLALLGSDVSSQLSTADQDRCLDLAASGGDYCPWLAASEGAYLLGGRAKAGTVTRFTADGATFQKEQDWFGWGDWLKSKSPRSNGPGFGDGFAFLVL